MIGLGLHIAGYHLGKNLFKNASPIKIATYSFFCQVIYLVAKKAMQNPEIIRNWKNKIFSTFYSITNISSIQKIANQFFKTNEKELSLEEKVGQLLMIHFQGETANENAQRLIQEIKVGGIIYYNFSNSLNSPLQIKSLSEGLQKLASIPLLVATDQEGGLVTRATNGFTVFPGNKALAKTGDPKLAQAAAYAMGIELQAVGINMNLAPVADVNTNPKNPIIGIRSFGQTFESVFHFVKSALIGYQAAKIITTLKHFPDHGDTETDSHTSLPCILKNIEELEKTSLPHFCKLALLADAVMTAHILVPALDAENCSTLSIKTLSILRKTGFQGVIISDSLVMEGVLKKCGEPGEAAIQAFNAGCDILLLGGKQLVGKNSLELSSTDIQQIHQSLVDAVKEGRISESRLNESVQRILKLKHLKELPRNSVRLDKILKTKEHLALSLKIASLALEIIPKNACSLTTLKDLQKKQISIFCPDLLQEKIKETDLPTISNKVKTSFFKDINFLESEIKEAYTSDVLIALSYNAWENETQRKLIESLIKTEKPLILLVMRDPIDQELFRQAELTFIAFSPTAVSIQAITNKLKKF